MRWLPALVLATICSAARAAAPGPVVTLSIDGPIGPATSDYIERGIKHATGLGAQLVVLRMDTPGGLDTSMRAIIKDIIAAPMPVAAFVAPSGARAASAGTFLMYASHIAAMAPGTNLGAATPVSLGGGLPTPEKGKDDKGDKGEKKDDVMPEAGALGRKAVHDAAAYIRGLAQMRGRNAEFAERAVREAISQTAEEALANKVIEIVAADTAQLLEKLDGKKVTAAGAERTLQTRGTTVIAWAPDWRTEFLSVITHPSIAYILLLVGIYALIFEFMNPGLVLPGVVGAISLLIALYALHLLPVNYAGLGLIVLGIGLMIAEVFVPAYGSLGVGGIIAFVIGSVILIDTDVPGFGVPYALIGGFAAASLAFLLFVATVLLKSRRRPVVSGREELIGAQGVVMESFEREGWAQLHGETWRIRSPSPLAKGQRITVTAMRGLTLDVTPTNETGVST